MAAGGELIIDDKLVRAIHDMEKALQGVTKEADATQRKTMAWLSSLSSGNIDAFTNKIKQLESNYMNFANALSNVKGFENISEKALNTAGAITQLITVMGQNTPKKTDGFDSIRQTLDSLLDQLAKARQDIDLYYQAIGTGKKEYVEFGQTGLKEAESRAESLMRKIEALNTTYQQLKQSSFNITDITKGTMDDERNRIELSGIKMRLQEEERIHKAVMEHNLEELKAINDKIEAGIQGEKALAKAEEERHRKRQEYYNNVGKQWDIDDKAIRDANMAELKGISDKIENAKRAEKEAVESAKREHDAKQKYYEDFGKVIEEEEKRKKQANTDYYNWEMEQLAKEVKAAQDAANKKLQAEQEYAAKRKELQAMYTSLWHRNEADMMSARVAQRTDGQTWNVDANEVIRRTQEELAQRRQYVAERTAMYERMFEDIERKERKVQDDIRNYEQQKQNESLAKYKQQKEEQARVDKHYHDKRQREYDEMFKAIERNENRQRAINAKYGDSSKGALNYSNRLYSTNGVRSIQNMETALNKLRDAQRRLNVGTEEGRKRYAELGAQIKKIEGDLNRVTNASERMKKSHSGLINTGQQLARQLALVFSVSQIEGYINNIVQVRKEFELQQKSLQVLVRDQSEANKIWTQTVQLAVKSPFRVKELVTYTKQLAAYRIETEKLHDTTRMLADVSAGLGVDMNRLILAYGQVRAAEFLRGTELRQFTEAGIPMLEELADHFSMLEGRAVSTADVFERISKRMVMFEDVNAVFEKMTSEGGTFYKMQEKQSETLYGTISNLHDSLDLMMNDIGKSNEGVIKRGLSLVKWLVEHWELVAEAVKATVAAFALYKIHVLQTKKALIDFAIANNIATGNKPLSMLNLLSIGWTKLAKSIKLAKAALLSNPITMIVLAAATAAYKLYNAWDLHNEKLKEATKLYRETRAEIAKIDTKFIYGDANERRQRLSALIGKATQFNIPIDFEVKNLSDEEVDAKFNSIRNQIESTTAFIAEFNTALAKSDSWINPFDDLNDAFAETSKRASELFSLYERSRTSLVSFLKENGKLTDDIKKQLAARGEYDKNETEIEYIERLNKAYDTYLNVVRLSNKAIAKMDVESARQTHQKWAQVWGDEMYNDIIKIRDTMLSYKNSLIDTNKEFEEFAKGLRIPPMSDEQRTVFIKTAIDEKGWDGFTTSLWYKLANEKFSVNITPTIADKKDTEDWKKRVTAAVKKLNSKIKTELGDKTPETLFPLPSESDSQESWLNRYKEAIKEIKTVFLDGQELFDKSEVADKNALKPYTREAEIIANIADKTTKAERDANTILNKRISLIKEIHSAYEKERKLWDEGTSEERVLQSYMLAYEDAFGKSISGYNFKIKEGVSSELLELVPLAEKAGKEAMIALERAIASVEVESGDFKKNIADEELIRQVEDMFGTYELSLELKDMNIPTDIAEKLFGFESLDLEGLKEELKKLKPKFIGTNQEKEYRDYLQKVEKMEAKALEERMNKYAKFLEQEQTERVKIKLNEVRQLMEIEDTFRIHEKDAREKYELTDEQWKAYEEQRKQGKAITAEFLKRIGLSDKQTEAIIQQNKLLTEQANIARKGVTRVTQEDLDKNAWEEFKKSPYYEILFSDLESAGTRSLVRLKNRVIEMKDTLKTLPPEIYKQVVEAIDKVDAQLTTRNPLGTVFEAWDDLRRISKEGVEITKIGDDGKETKERVQSRKDIAEKLGEEQKILETKREEASVIQQILQADTKTRHILAEKNQIALKVLQTTNGNNDALAKELNTTKKVVAVHEENVEKLGREEAKYRSIEAKMDGAKKGIQEWANATTDLIGSVDSLLDSLGLAEDSQARIWLKASMGIVDTIASVAQLIIQFTLMEVAANSALGIIGYIATALKAIATLFATLFGNPDEGLQKQIEALEVSVEALDRKFQKLEKSIKNAMGVDDINRFTDDAIQNLEDQNKALGEMIALEEAKKGTDADKIRDWANEMEDNIEEMERLRNERIKELGGIGGAEEIKSAAEEFTDAWLQAFLETGDGLVGLEDKFNDFARNLIKSQLMHRVVESLITPLTTKINEIVDPLNEGGGDVTDKEWQELMLLWNEQKGVINERLSSLIEELGGLDSLSSNRDLEGLQKGVQSIQESTAQEIVSYMNSLRALLSQRETFYKNNEQLSSLLDNIVTDGINPMLDQLRVIANNTESIHTLLDSVVRAGHSQGGYGIKVFSD